MRLATLPPAICGCLENEGLEPAEFFDCHISDFDDEGRAECGILKNEVSRVHHCIAIERIAPRICYYTATTNGVVEPIVDMTMNPHVGSAG
jgi:hypothetical protein